MFPKPLIKTKHFKQVSLRKETHIANRYAYWRQEETAESESWYLKWVGLTGGEGAGETAGGRGERKPTASLPAFSTKISQKLEAFGIFEERVLISGKGSLVMLFFFF